MRSTLLKYGLLALLLMLSLFLLSMVAFQNFSYSTQEALGYISMLVALSVIYFAVRHYRDGVNGGYITFGRGLLIGLIITQFAAVGSAIADLIFTTAVNPDFITEFRDAELERLRNTLSPEEFEKASAELLEQIAQLGSPVVLAVLMFATVVILGFIISLLSAFFLKKTRA